MLNLIVLTILVQVLRALEITWALEDYNDWNLPFAKTVEIKSRAGGRTEF